MIIYDLINLKKIRKAILYIVCLAVTLTLQGSFFSRISILGVKSMFVPVIIVAIGLFEGGMWGGVFGVIAGIFCDIASSDTTVLFTIVLAVEGFVAGLMGETLINRRFYSYVIVAVLALALLALCQIVPVWLYKGSALPPLLRTGALQTLWSVPFTVPAYFACKAIAGYKTR